MKVIRYKLDSQVSQQLETLTKELRLDDSGFAEDVYLMLSGKPIPSEETVDRLAAPYSKALSMSELSARLALRHRRIVLIETSELDYFKALYVQVSVSSLYRRTESFLRTLRLWAAKVTASQCMGCTQCSTCAFGQKYSAETRNILDVYDPEADQLVSGTCPYKDGLLLRGEISKNLRQMKQLKSTNPGAAMGQGSSPGGLANQGAAEKALSVVEVVKATVALDPEDTNELLDQESSDVGVGGGAAGTGGATILELAVQYTEATEKFVSRLSGVQLALFDMGASLLSALGKASGNDFRPTEEVGDAHDTRSDGGVEKIARRTPLERTLPEDIQTSNLVEHSAQVHQNLVSTGRAKICYVLIDASGSMYSSAFPASTNAYRLMTRMQVAAVLSSALARHVIGEGGQYYLRHFTGDPGPLYSAKNIDELPALLSYLMRTKAGGGTSITNALTTAFFDLEHAVGDFALAEVLLITDMDDDLSPGILSNRFKVTPNLKVHVMNIKDPNERSYGNAEQILKAEASRYLVVDPNAPSIQDFVKLSLPSKAV